MTGPRKGLETIVEKEIRTVSLDTPSAELFEILYDLPYPLAVVDDDYKLKGVITRGALLGALAEGGN